MVWARSADGTLAAVGRLVILVGGAVLQALRMRWAHGWFDLWCLGDGLPSSPEAPL